jgi:hypothetical protein
MALLNPFNSKKKINLPKIFLYILTFLIIIIFLFLVMKMLKNQSIEKFDTSSTNTNSTKKIAFCFLTIDNFNQTTIWNEFFKGNEERYSIYIHPKHHDRVDEPYKKYVIQNLIETKWGNTSLIQATLNLFKTAYENENNKICVLVSDSCIPLYNFDYIYNKLINEEKCYNILSLKYSPENEMRKRYSALKNNNPDFLTFQQFKKCSQWCAINRETVKFLIENNYLHYYKGMFASDEHYFINLFDKFNISYKTFNITFDNWQQLTNWIDPQKTKKYKRLPKTYEEVNTNEINEARDSQALFFRKVVPETSINIIKILNNQ